ncbi:MAG: hypothetical protein ACR2P0_06095 [Acidimicrobiales bacterium]
MTDFIELPIPEIDGTEMGPSIGSRFPDFALPDQSANVIDLHEHRGKRKAIIVFHRSADW